MKRFRVVFTAVMAVAMLGLGLSAYAIVSDMGRAELERFADLLGTSK